MKARVSLLESHLKIKSEEYINKLSKENIDASEIKKITNSYLNDIQVIDKDVYKKLTESMDKSRVRSVEQVECETFLGEGNLDFTGKLRGENVTLKDVKTKEVTYVKRSLEERKALRTAFDSTERKNFLIRLSENEQLLKDAGLTEIDILDMKDGLVPEGWQVHHKLPLDDSGDNSFQNLVLIKNEPYHKVITNYQNSIVRGLKEGEIKKIEFPIPGGNIYPLKK